MNAGYVVVDHDGLGHFATVLGRLAHEFLKSLAVPDVSGEMSAVGGDGHVEMIAISLVRLKFLQVVYRKIGTWNASEGVRRGELQSADKVLPFRLRRMLPWQVCRWRVRH